MEEKIKTNVRYFRAMEHGIYRDVNYMWYESYVW